MLELQESGACAVHEGNDFFMDRAGREAGAVEWWWDLGRKEGRDAGWGDCGMGAMRNFKEEHTQAPLLTL